MDRRLAVLLVLAMTLVAMTSSQGLTGSTTTQAMDPLQWLWFMLMRGDIGGFGRWFLLSHLLNSGGSGLGTGGLMSSPFGWMFLRNMST